MPRIFAFILQKNGVPEDGAQEMVTAAARIDAGALPTAILMGWGPGLDAACETLRHHYSEIWKIADKAFDYPNAEVIRAALVQLVPAGSIVLVAHSHFGVDLSPGLSVKLNAAYVPDVTAIEQSRGNALDLVRQEFGGQVSVHVRCDVSSGAVLNIRTGSFAGAAAAASEGVILDKRVDLGSIRARRRYVETIAAESGDVDITKYRILVSVGRGIQSDENIAMAQELAEAVGGAVSCSRPVVDAKWMEKSRQVGSSGKTVKPNVYLACGISGSFQHLAGLKGNPFIIAINKNPNAPIFQVADIGIVDDILQFLPALTCVVQGSTAVKER